MNRSFNVSYNQQSMLSAFLMGASCLAMLSCNTIKVNVEEIQLRDDASHQIKALNEFSKEFSVLPGQVTLLKFPYWGPFKNEALVCNDKAVPFFTTPREPNMATAYLARSYFDEDEAFVCEFRFHINDGDAAFTKLPVGRIVTRTHPYPEERLSVDHRRVTLSQSDQELVAREKKMLEDLYLDNANTLLFSEPFSEPLRSKITSIYGTKRIFNDDVKTQHLGTDYRARIGTPIKASNSGRVIFAGELFYGGNTVIVDHGLGIFTTYSHLDKIVATRGQSVTKETLLGYSGMTGRVNGPHLHWGALIHGHWVDGHSLIQASDQMFVDDSDIKRAEAGTP